MSDELIDTRLGQYHITEVIRRGGMSMVYKAYQASLDRDVAVKVLRYNRDPQFAARFKREARAIAKLQHHNILPIYDYDEQDDLLYLVLQYIENGQTLGDMLGTPIEPSAALRLVGHVLDALDYAHTRGIIHRDIKPSNVLMPSPQWPMLADFGIAKLINDNQAQLTVPGLIIGTAAYMSPEQATGQPIDARTDLYATGVMLYELVTGRVPFDADTPMAVLAKHAYEPPLPPRSLNPDLPAPVEAALLKALAKEPTARYQSAAAMAADLVRLANQIEQGRARGQITGFYQAGVQAFEAGHWDEAVERFGELVKIDPDYEDATELLEAAREAQEQARLAARQQLDLVRQRRQSTIQRQVDVPPIPTSAPPRPDLGRPAADAATHETKRIEPVAPAPPMPPSRGGAGSAPTPDPAATLPSAIGAAAPPAASRLRRYTPWALGAALIVAALALLLGRGGPSPAPEPTAAPLGGNVSTTNPAATVAATTASQPTAAPIGAPAPTVVQPTTAPTSAAPPEPAGKLVFADDFNADAKAEVERNGLEDAQDDPNFSRGLHAPGVYHFKVPISHDTRWEILPRRAYRDFTMQIELWDNSDNLTGDVSQGIVFRLRDDGHFYALLLDPRKGLYSVRKQNGPDQTALIDWKDSRLIKRKNEHNMLRVDATGDTFTIYLNDQQLDSFSDAEYRFGMLGMIVANVDANVDPQTPHMHFDNLKVWSNDPPLADTSLPLVKNAPTGDILLIAGGDFIMGSYQREGERPPHIVAMDSFYIDRTEVTNAAYRKCMAAGKCKQPADESSKQHQSYFTDTAFDAFPVIHVTWEQARDFCAWAGKRLPTEAEWEKAASWNAATSTKSVWPWGDEFDATRLNTDDQYDDTTRVGSFDPEMNGTFDMAGNVWEWTSSLDKGFPYNKDDGREDPQAAGNRIVRGGSWAQSNGARGAYRNPTDPTYSDREIGFRCAVSP